MKRKSISYSTIITDLANQEVNTYWYPDNVFSYWCEQSLTKIAETNPFSVYENYKAFTEPTTIEMTYVINGNNESIYAVNDKIVTDAIQLAIGNDLTILKERDFRQEVLGRPVSLWGLLYHNARLQQQNRNPITALKYYKTIFANFAESEALKYLGKKIIACLIEIKCFRTAAELLLKMNEITKDTVVISRNYEWIYYLISMDDCNKARQQVIDDPITGDKILVRSLLKQAKLGYQQKEDIDSKARCNVKYMGSLKSNKKGVSKLIHTINRDLWLYGEVPSRLILNGILIILIFALGYLFWGFTYQVYNGIENDIYFVQYGVTKNLIAEYPRAIYYSCITFATLGYGDSLPVGCISKLLASIEAIIGSIMMSMVLVSVSRKYLTQ